MGGAILSVPLTAVMRMVLLETDHPYAKPIVHLLKGDMRANPEPQRPSVSTVGALPVRADKDFGDTSVRGSKYAEASLQSSEESDDGRSLAKPWSTVAPGHAEQVFQASRGADRAHACEEGCGPPAAMGRGANSPGPNGLSG